MRQELIEGPMQSHLAKAVGCVLSDITVAVFRTEFRLLDDMAIILKINKEFKFALSKGEELRFDPALELHDPSIESTKFILLQGRRCSRATLDKAKLELNFEGGARVWVEFSEWDFEPFELIGLSGERHEKMDFYYVL
jgi:hypothetical protein